MPAYIITAKPDCTAADIEALKQQCRDQGGNITHEYSLIRGFSVEYPEDAVMTLENHPHVDHVEKDQTMMTQ